MLAKWFTRRRVGASAGASVVVHLVLVAGVWDWSRGDLGESIAAAGTDVVDFEPTAAAAAALPPRVVVVGPRVSGRGHARAGSDPICAGLPLRAQRTQWASGRANGPGGDGHAADRAFVRAAAAADDAPAPPSELAPAEGMTVPLAASPAEVADAPPRPPGAPSVDADRTLEDLVRAQNLRLSQGDGGGQAGRGPGGTGVGIGLGTEVSGRHVEKSRVATPPVVTSAQQVECELPRLGHLETVVRLLVTREGAGILPRLLRSSGHGEFDGCALRYVRAMRFAPGVDAGGQPLDVWIHLHVAPTTAARLAGSAR